MTDRTDRGPAPVADRPVIPREYGAPTSTKGLKPWPDVAERLRTARVYWIATCGPGGVPRVRPIDGLYLDGVVYLGGSPEARWVRDLEANPRATVHLDGGYDVVILEGSVERVDPVPRDLAERLAAASAEKYPEYGITAESYETQLPFALRPVRGFAWSAFPRDVTRYRFGG